MTFLVDTHIWLWLNSEPERLGTRILDILQHPDTSILLSAVCSWEIAIKYEAGRLDLPEAPQTYVPSRMNRTGTRGLDITHAHALRAGALEAHHRDPFDRLLIAQAAVEGLPVVTADPVFKRYPVEVLQAG